MFISIVTCRNAFNEKRRFAIFTDTKISTVALELKAKRAVSDKCLWNFEKVTKQRLYV